MKIKFCILWGILISSLIIPFVGKAETSVSAWDFYCKYLANAISAEIGYKDSFAHEISGNSLTSGKYRNENTQLSIRSNILTFNESDSYYNQNLGERTELNMKFTAPVSNPYFEEKSVIWKSDKWEMNALSIGGGRIPTNKSGNTPWTLDAYHFVLKEVAGNTYTFTCSTTTKGLTNAKAIVTCRELGDNPTNYSCKERTLKLGLRQIKLTIPSSALSDTDEFGKWKWTEDKSEIWVSSTGVGIINTSIGQFKIIRQGNSLRLALEGSSIAFGSPASTSNGYEIYEVGFTFGDSYQTLKFINAGTSPLGKRLIYGSYNRFTGELDTDATSVLQQFKTNKYCAVKVSAGQNVQSFVFPLEGLETLMDYIN